jgi:hypothetical protein
MPSSPTLHDWDVLFFGVPLILFLVVGFFRLESPFALAKSSRNLRRKPLPIPLRDDSAMMTDPDGRPWNQN